MGFAGMENRVEQSMQFRNLVASQLAMDEFQYSMFQKAIPTCEKWSTEVEKNEFNILIGTFPEPVLLMRKTFSCRFLHPSNGNLSCLHLFPPSP